MKRVTMLGCAIVEAAVLTTPEVWSQPEVHAVPWTISPASVIPLDPAETSLSVRGDSHREMAAIHSTDDAPPQEESAPSVSGRARGFSPAALLRATVPSAFLGNCVCMINHDTGEVTLVNLTEFGGPLPHGRGAELTIQPDPGVLHSAIIQSICLVPDDWLPGACDTFRHTEVGSRVVARLGTGLKANASGLASIPEPQTLAFLGLGPLALAMLRRRV